MFVDDEGIARVAKYGIRVDVVFRVNGSLKMNDSCKKNKVWFNVLLTDIHYQARMHTCVWKKTSSKLTRSDFFIKSSTVQIEENRLRARCVIRGANEYDKFDWKSWRLTHASYGRLYLFDCEAHLVM